MIEDARKRSQCAPPKTQETRPARDTRRGFGAESSTPTSFGEMLTQALLQARNTPGRHQIAVTAPRSTYKIPRTLDGKVVPVAKAFDRLPPTSPLRELNDTDQESVWASLHIYKTNWVKRVPGHGPKRKNTSNSFKANREPRAPKRSSDSLNPAVQELGRIVQAASDAAKLASKIENLLQNDWGEVLNRRLMKSRELPVHLNSFASQVDGLLDALGKNGYQIGCAIEDQFLIYASEKVRHRTKRWNDSHLADLFQVIEVGAAEPALRASERAPGAAQSEILLDLSGETICRIRDRFKKKHPELYNLTVLRASRDTRAGASERKISSREIHAPAKDEVRKRSKKLLD
jgi:hypothetical protein